MAQFDVTRAIPTNDIGERQPDFDVSRAVATNGVIDYSNIDMSGPLTRSKFAKPTESQIQEIEKEQKGSAATAAVIRWPFWRFIEHPVSAVVEDAQKGAVSLNTVGRAAQAFVPFKQIPKEEYGSYANIWAEYYRSTAALQGVKEEAPDWYVAMASFGSAGVIEPLAIAGAVGTSANAMTRVASAEEAASVRTHFEPLKEALSKRGLDTAKLHPEGNIIRLDSQREVFINKYLSAVLRGDEVRVPRWAKIKPATKPASIDSTPDFELAPVASELAPITGKSTVLTPKNVFPPTMSIDQARIEALKIKPTYDINTPERIALRNSIINNGYDNWSEMAFGNSPKAPKQTGPGARIKNKEAWIIIGSPASGKSQVVNPLLEKHGAMLIDNDVYKTQLPEFNKGIGAHATHGESSNLIEAMVLSKAIANGDNIVTPRLGKNPKAMQDLRDKLIRNGYTVHLKLVELPVDKAAKRAETRFKETGRFVDPEFVKHVGLTPTNTYVTLKAEGGFSSYERLSTDVPKGSQPAIIDDAIQGVEDGGGGTLRGLQGESGDGISGEVGRSDSNVQSAEITPELIKPRSSGTTLLEEKIAALKTKEEQSDVTRDYLASVNEQRKQFLRRIRNYKDGKMAEELSAIPRHYKTSKGGLSPDEAMQELRDMGIDIKDEQALAEYLVNLDDQRSRIMASLEKPNMVSMKELTILKEKLNSAKIGFKEGVSATKETTKAIQDSIISLIEDSGLPTEYRGRFLRSVKNIQTPEQLNRAIGDLAIRVNELADKVERSNLADAINRINTSNISIDYAQAIDKIRDSIDLKTRGEKSTAKIQSLREFVEKMKAEGKDINIPKSTLDSIDKKLLGDISIDELKDIKLNIEHLARLGKTKLAAREAVYQTKKINIAEKLLNDIEAINSKKLPEVEIGAEPNKMAQRYVDLMNYITKTKVGLTPIEGLADVTGMQKMKKVMDKNFGDYLSFNDKDFKAWDDLTKKMTEGQLKKIGTYAAAQQEGGVERLLNSGLSEEAINSIVLTPEELKAYNFVRETFDKHYPEVARFSKEVYNEEVGKVDNYVSFLSDYEKMSDLEMYDRFGQRPEEAVNRRTKTVEQGFRKERSNISNIKLETNIDKIFHRHLDDVAYMLTMGRDIKMFSEIVNTPEIRDALGDVGSMAWLQYLDLMARKGGVDSAKRIALLDIVRRNVGVGVLAFRASSALVQVSSFGDTMATIGPEWATRGATNIATSPEWRNFIMDNFPEIRKAVGDDVAFREFGENMFSGAIKVGMKPLQVMDGLMRSTAASGAYEKIAKEKGVPVDLENPDQEIIQEATKLMRQSQGSSYFKDQPLSITTGYGLTDNTSLNKTILQFQSFMLGRWDNINRQIWRLGIKEKDFGKAFSSLFWLFTFGLGTEEFIRRGVKKASGRKNNSIAQGMITNAIQTIPLVGQVASSITYGSNPVPVIKATQDAIDALKQSNEAKTAKTRKKARIKAVGAAATLLGVPGATTATQLIVGKNKKKNTIR